MKTEIFYNKTETFISKFLMEVSNLFTYLNVALNIIVTLNYELY